MLERSIPGTACFPNQKPVIDVKGHNQELMLITSHEREVPLSFISTEDSLAAVCPALSEYANVDILHSLDDVPVYRHFRADGSPLFDAQYVSITNPETAASQLAAFLSRADSKHPSSFSQIAPDRLSPAARHLLSRLLNPILEECHGALQHADPLLYNTRWSDNHREFLNDLDSVFSRLDLITVARHRPSITQGTVSVICCGREVVRYGDDQWKDLGNGHITNGFREKEGRLYGRVLDGWGSAQPDSAFRSAALVQFTPRLHTCLTQDKSFSQLLSNARARSNTPAQTETPSLHHER